MGNRLQVFVAALGLLSVALQGRAAAIHPRANSISWGPCPAALNITAPFVCGDLTVPLDYTNLNSTATVRLELIKLPVQNGTSKGSILFNPGGPGGSGLQQIAVEGKLFQIVTGGQHDLIGFDPRGVGNTMTFECYNTSDPADVIRASTISQQAWVSGNSSDVALGRLWAASNLLASDCYGKQNLTGNFTGTAFVARDIFQIVDALGEDGLLRYWGFSYGTLLGATAVAMFPDRVDKIVLDGVANPHQYWNSFDEDQLSDLDLTFRGFLEECIATPSRCALSARRPNATVESLESLVRELIFELKYNPIAVPGAGIIIDYTLLKSQILQNMYYPPQWSDLAAGLDALLTKPRNLTVLAQFVAVSVAGAIQLPQYANLAIRCGDKVRRASTLDQVRSALAVQANSSWIAGDAVGLGVTTCSQWGMEAAERYSGDFRVKTRAPVLLISTTLDPTTPIRSARNVSAGFEGSVLLERKGYGHCTDFHPSLCTYRAVRDYFTKGVLPAPGTKCETDVEMFADRATVTAGWVNLLGTLRNETLLGA